MVTITERAAVQLQELLAANEAPQGQGVKLVPDETGRIAMTIGPVGADDEVIEHDGEPLLIVDGRIAAMLEGAQLDCDTAEIGGERHVRWSLQPPS
jgi:Fe-S cluster assembly iron-binding protein IscA